MKFMDMSAEEALVFQAKALVFIECDYEKGLFRRKIKTSGKCKDGWHAGTKNHLGYTQLSVFGSIFLGHQLVWIMYYGAIPKYEIDHENRIRSDNRIVNLRDVTCAENQKNAKMSIKNTSGHTGVCFDKSARKWKAYIQVDNTSIHLGLFDDINDAIAARAAAEIKYGFHKNHGRRT